MMGPTRLDSVSSEECRKVLRRMELEAYGSVVSTLRAQGELTKDRKKLLEDLSALMKISPERHKAEIRRAVNDEKLGCIANRLSGGVDTEWSWALEGRRVVPLMPRLVYPTPFTALATNVSKIINQNPRICLNQTPVTSADEPGASRYVRDPDDEDTLSPVMVPIASPDSSCHSNNNFESDFADYPHLDKNSFSHGHEVEKKTEPSVVKKLAPFSTNVNPIKRPRSPSSQVVNVSAPMSKVRAVSPNCVRPMQKVVTSTSLPYQPSPRGQILNSIRPTMQQHQQHMTSPISVPGKIRIRAPVVQAIGRTAPTNVRPTMPQNFTQTTTSIPRTVTNNNAPPVKQVVQIRTTSQQQFQLQQQQQKQQISSHTNQANANAVRTAPTVNSVASTIAKTLPGKANVIVLHKNSPMAQTITTVARENERCSVVNKTNFLPKTVSTPTGTKMTFPGNVRIISVPSGSVAGSPGVVGNHASLAQKIMSSSVSGGATAQKNVYVLELTNDTVSKSVIMGEVVPASLVSELNGIAPKTAAPTPSVKEGIEASRENETKTEILNTGNVVVNGVKNSESDAIHKNYGCNVLPSADSSAAENNVQHESAQLEIPSAKQEDSDLVVKLEPGTLELHVAEITPSYSSSTDEQGNELELKQSSTDIFTSAIASAGINMETTAPFNNEDNAAGTRLILTDVYDSPSAKS